MENETVQTNVENEDISNVTLISEAIPEVKQEKKNYKSKHCDLCNEFFKDYYQHKRVKHPELVKKRNVKTPSGAVFEIVNLDKSDPRAAKPSYTKSEMFDSLKELSLIHLDRVKESLLSIIELCELKSD